MFIQNPNPEPGNPENRPADLAKTQKSPRQPAITYQTLVVAVILSLVLGTLGGAVAGLFATGQFDKWFNKTFSNKTSAPSDTTQTLSVKEESETVEVVKKVQPSVVSIIISKDLSKIYSQSGPYSFFFGPQPRQGLQQVGGGSGFILTADGYIMTNKHVVNDDQAEYSVVTNDGKTYAAKVVATDPFNDLAVVKIEANNLKSLQLGNSDALQIGQTVIAIGNALGQYENTVTKGIVSGLAREVTAGDGNSSENLSDVIQTDAAINPGNSGGPLVDLSGAVIGVNTAVSQEGQLIGFAIPSNEASKVFESVRKTGKVVRPYLGVRYVQVTQEIQAQEKLSVDYGALIQKGSGVNEPAIVPGSPAEKAGLQADDIILELDGVKIDDDHSLASEIQKHAPGDSVTLKILSGGKEKTIEVTLAELKQ
ncbi:PDZ domain-containing protein [Candidatus Parcubacteria bacterium]|jgi:serine protease Do|nr:MAG: PDZ domain-containing protein [Candidatus Parcubacteria bacterium]